LHKPEQAADQAPHSKGVCLDTSEVSGTGGQDNLAQA